MTDEMMTLRALIEKSPGAAEIGEARGYLVHRCLATASAKLRAVGSAASLVLSVTAGEKWPRSVSETNRLRMSLGTRRASDFNALAPCSRRGALSSPTFLQLNHRLSLMRDRACGSAGKSEAGMGSIATLRR